MINVEFSQTICKGSLRVVDDAASVELYARAGIAEEDSNSLKAQDCSFDLDTIQRLWNRNIFSRPSDVALIGDRLAVLSKEVHTRGLEFTAFMTQQSEAVAIVTSEQVVEDIRRWDLGRVAITTDSGQMAYRDIFVGSQVKDILERFNLAVKAVLQEVSDWDNKSVGFSASPMTVLFAPGTGGYFVHEVFGHMLEGDFVAKGLSMFGKKIHIGEKVGPEGLNVIDDPSNFSEYVGLGLVDDEGELLSGIELVSGGLLKGYLCNRETAKLLGNGMWTSCARRQSYKHKSIPRMRATYIPQAGSGQNLSELIVDTERGFLASQLMAGHANPLTGDFMLRCGRGYLVEDGRVTAPVRGATLHGNILSVLQGIVAIGDDFEMLPLQCSKAGQIVPVCVGSPAIKVNGITVRGPIDER